MTSLEKEIAYFKSNGKFIIQGDFNARTGHEQDLITFSRYFENKIDVTTHATNSCDRPCRNSEDSVVTSRGRTLIDLCISCNLYIVDGKN